MAWWQQVKQKKGIKRDLHYANCTTWQHADIKESRNMMACNGSIYVEGTRCIMKEHYESIILEDFDRVACDMI